MRRILIGVVLALVISSLPRGARAIDARELIDSCEAVSKGSTGKGEHIRIPYTKAALLCWGYVQAVQDFSMLADASGNRLLGACPPADTTTLAMVKALLRYARAHPGSLPDNTAILMIGALQDAFPCTNHSGKSDSPASK